MTSHKNTNKKCTSPILTPRRGYHKSSLYFIQSFFIQTIGVKIVETLISFRGHFKLGLNIPHPPHPPRTMLYYFLFPKTLTNSGTTLIRGEGEGIPAKVLFRLFFFENNKSVLTSVLCLQSVSTNFVADRRLATNV